MMFHIIWRFHNICSLSSSKLPLDYLYSDLVNPLWDGLPKHDIKFKTCKVYLIKSTVMGLVVIGIVNQYKLF